MLLHALFLSLCVRSGISGVCSTVHDINIGLLFNDTTDEYAWINELRNPSGQPAQVPLVKDLSPVCFKAVPKDVPVPSDPSEFLSKKTNVDVIKSNDLLIGPYFSPIADAAAKLGIPYLTVVPIKPTQQVAKLRKPESDFIISIWPTWSQIVQATIDYYAFLQVSSVYIIAMDFDEQTVAVAESLYQGLLRLPKMEHVAILELSLPENYDSRSIKVKLYKDVLIDAVMETFTKDIAVVSTTLKPQKWLTELNTLFDRNNQFNLDSKDMRATIIDMELLAKLNGQMAKYFDEVMYAEMVYMKLSVPADNANETKSISGLALEDVKVVLKETLTKFSVTGITSKADLASTIQASSSKITASIGQSLAFDGEGRRSNFSLTFESVSELGKVQKTLGSWNGEYVNQVSTGDAGAVMIGVVLKSPFIRYKEGTSTGGESFEGIVVDIFKRIETHLQNDYDKSFTYKFVAFEDGVAGVKLANKSWNGLFGKLKQNEILIAAGVIFKTAERVNDFEFLPGIGFTSLSFLIKKDESSDWLDFQFLRPYSLVVWVSVLVAFIIGAAVVFGFDYVHPLKDKITDDNHYTVKESLWYSFLTLTQVGGEIVCTLVPTQVFSVFYWFFAFVVLACYTSNLASFLTEKTISRASWMMEDLAGQEDVKFGYVTDTAVMEYMQASQLTAHITIADRVTEAGMMVKNHSEGTTKVLMEDFAYIDDRYTLEDAAASDEKCDLIVAPASAGNFEIAWPISPNQAPRGVAYPRDHIKLVMKKMGYSGEFQDIINTWTPGRGGCKNSDEDIYNLQMTPSNFSSLFLVVGLGVLLSVLVLAADVGYRKIKERKQVRSTTTEVTSQHESQAFDNAIEDDAPV